MKHTITEFKEWPKGLEVSYHDWVIKASKEEIAKKIGFKPKYHRGGPKCTYTWRCSLDNGRYFFTIYDMSYGRRLGKNDVIEYHIGFDCNYDDIHEFWPNKLEALDMLEALDEIGLTPCHSDLWTKFHATGAIKKIEELIRKNLYGGNTEFHD